MPMRVLHVYRTYFPDPTGGLQEAIRQISLATGAHGVENRVFALTPEVPSTEIARPEGLVVRSRSWMAPASCDLGGFAAFRFFSDQVAWADIVHYHFPWPFADVLHLFTGQGKPAVMTYHSDIVRQQWLGKLYVPLMNRMLLSMDAIVATSPAYAATSPVLSKPEIASRVKVIPLGIDECSYPIVSDESIIERLGIGGKPFFLFIGVLRYYKGLHTLIRAAGAVDARIVIAGSGPEDESLLELTRQFGAANVVFAGQVADEEKVLLIQRSRALVLPSHLRSEAFGMVLVEAAMFGKPMISCEIGTGTSFVNADGETGLVVPPENPDALAQAMNSLLENKVLAEAYGQSARARYERLFSGEALGKAYSDLYREVLSHYLS